METYQGAPLVLDLSKLGFLGILVTHHFHRRDRKPGASSLAKEQLVMTRMRVHSTLVGKEEVVFSGW